MCYAGESGWLQLSPSEAGQLAKQYGPYFFALAGILCTRWSYHNYIKNFIHDGQPESIRRNAVNVRIVYSVLAVSVLLTFVSVVVWILNAQQKGIFAATIALEKKQFVCSISEKHWIFREPPDTKNGSTVYRTRVVVFGDGPLETGTKIHFYYGQTNGNERPDQDEERSCDQNVPLLFTFKGNNNITLRIDPVTSTLFDEEDHLR